jgi:PTS system fructose-specific IIC component
MSRPWAGVIAILVNVVVTAVVLAVIKKNVTEEDAAMHVEKEEEDINLEDIQIF